MSFYVKKKIVFINEQNKDFKQRDSRGLPVLPMLIIEAVNMYHRKKVKDITTDDLDNFINTGNAIYCNIEDIECVVEKIKGSIFNYDYGFLGRDKFYCRVTFSGKFQYLNNEFIGTIAAKYDNKQKTIHKEFNKLLPSLSIRQPEQALSNHFATAINEKVEAMKGNEILDYYEDEDYFNQ